MTDRLATFEKGEAIEVPVQRIEQELAALWRAAARASADGKPRAVTRACLWNLVVRVEGESDFMSTKRLIDELSAHVPTRVILVRPQLQREGDRVSEGEIHAWVETNWRRAEGGQVANGSDEVTLTATGRAVGRLLSLVRSLLIPDAPSAMMWVGPPPAASAPVRDLLGEIDRLIVDTRKLPSEIGLAELAALAAQHPHLELADLSWLGIAPLRGLCASLFDPPHDSSPLEVLDRVRVVSGVSGTQSRGLLALGWLGARLGWRDYRRVPGSADLRRWQATRRSGGSVAIELGTNLSGAHHGVTALELEAGGRQWSLHRDERCIAVRAPRLPDRLQPARSHSDAELTVTALGPRGRDPVFGAALVEVAQLIGAAS